jgi:CRP-like cAMP-binding protein
VRFCNREKKKNGALLLEPSRTNQLLRRLPPRDRQRLVSAMESVELPFGKTLYNSGERIRYVYFPNDGLVSLIATADDGKLAEVGLVGSEGELGGSIALSNGISPFQAIVQGAGTALRIKATHLRSGFRKMDSLQRVLLSFSYLLTAQVAQTAACNRFHDVSARLARWLLMTRDRQLTNEFRLTQQFLAHMLGVQRGGVSRAASGLKKRQIIRYSRGKITILNEKALAAVSCRCYQQVKNLYERA